MKNAINIIFTVLILTALCSAGDNPNISRLKHDADYFCYYGGFDENTVLQCQYFDLMILDVRFITPSQVKDIKDGFDNISGTDDDVIVLGYLSIGEQDGSLFKGDGTGPVYWDGKQLVHENKGYASYYVDDKDRNGLPDKDGIWNSYYVNAGDTAWWAYNEPSVKDILVEHSCDGLFLDLVDTAGPDSWGLPYEWSREGMIKYIEHLRQTNPGKYLLANRGIFYFEPSLPHYQLADRYRKSIDGLMIESYFAIWDWNTSRGYANPEFASTSTHFAPLLRAQADKQDGFNMFILDYMSKDQPDHDQLLKAVVNAAEKDQGWLVAVSSIFLNEIRYDTYHHHVTDFNPPTWTDIVGIASYKWNGDSLTIYWNKAVDQTLPVKYDLYLSDTEINFADAPNYKNITPQNSTAYDFMYTITGLDHTKKYKLCLRALDSAVPEHIDPSRKITVTSIISPDNFWIDGYFSDWSKINSMVTAETPLDSSYSPDPDANIINAWAAINSEKLYLSYELAGKITPSYFYHVFIDTDNDMVSKTGYIYNDSASIGSEFMIESNYLYRYTGAGGTDWAWEQVQGMEKADNGNRTEISIPLSSIVEEYHTGQKFNFILQVNQSHTPYGFMSIAPSDYKEKYFQLAGDPTGVNEDQGVIAHFHLEQNYPNPFNSDTIIRFSLNSDSIVGLKVYNNLGELVKTIIDDEYRSKGTYSLSINMSSLSSGIYFYKLSGENNQVTRTMMLLK